MTPFHRVDGAFHVEGVSVAELARRFGTPLYVYSRAALTTAYVAFDAAFGNRSHRVCYAVKANSNLGVLNVFVRLGAGFDIVSGGELARVLAAGGDPASIVFSGVGKSAAEIDDALRRGIRCFNVESEPELSRIERIAGGLGLRAPVSLRVNPDVDAGTHPYIATGLKENKFGIPIPDARDLFRRAARSPHLRVVGVDCHIGSQLTDLAPFRDALSRIGALMDDLNAAGIALEHVDVGGGLGIRYRDEAPPVIAEYVAVVAASLAGFDGEILIEPGRGLVGNAGILVATVEYVKQGPTHRFVIVDAAMNDLMRPSLYDAWHDIVSVKPRATVPLTCEVVGPVCESGDFLGHARELAVEAGDLLAVMSTGAYGMSMSSNYNTRPRAAEILVDGPVPHVVRFREEVADLFARERILPA